MRRLYVFDSMRSAWRKPGPDLSGGDWSDPSAWSPTGVPSTSDTATIAGTGAYTVLIAQSETVGSLALSDPGALLLATEASGAAAATFAISQGLAFDAGILDLSGSYQTGLGTGGSTYTTDTPVTLALAGGIDTDSGSAGGTILANIATLALTGSQTLDHVTLALANSVELTASGGTVTLGPDFVLQQTGSLDALDGSFVNEGRIAFDGATSVQIGATSVQIGATTPGNLVNSGTIAIGAGAVAASIDDFSNTGLVQIGGVLDLAVAGSFSNVGTLALAAGATLALTADTSLAALGRIDNAGGAVTLGGTLDLGGATLSDAPGGTFADLVLAGTVRDGTLASAGGKLGVQGGTFDAVTYAGTLDLSALGNATALAVADGLTVIGGTVDITGIGDTLQVLDSETLDHLKLNLGSPGGQAALRGDVAGTLALGPDTALNGFGGEMAISAATLVNQGRVAVAAGTLTMAATTLSNHGTIALGGTGASSILQAETLANSGDIQIGGGDTLVLQSVTFQDQPAPAGFANTGTMALGPGGVLELDTKATLAGLGAIGGDGGTLVVAPKQVWLQSTTGGVLDLGGGTLAIGDGTPFSKLIVDGTIENGTIELLPGATFDPPASATELDVTVVPCYLAGTRLLTTEGEVPVEALAVGQRAITASGKARPIVWIGERRIDCRRHPRPRLVWPVRVRAHALGTGAPKRDLLLSPDHAVSVAAADGAGTVLVPIRHLVNGLTVVQEPAASVRYFHIELASHDLLLAEGLPAESYLDTGNRDTFAASRGRRRRGRPALSWADACAPLRQSGADVAAARRRLKARAESLGWRAGSRAGLHLRAAGRSFAPASVKGRLHRFVLPDRTSDAEIVSHTGVSVRGGDGWRRLGVSIGAILVNGRIVPLDSATLGAGFHPAEREAGELWRWTDGAARLSLRPSRGPLLVELLLREAAPGCGARPAAPDRFAA
jgi:hypothetical protein